MNVERELGGLLGKYQPSFHHKSNMAVPAPIAYTSVVSNKEHVTNDLLKLPNDVVIILDDGQVEANKDLLSVRSDYFARSFNNPKFLESQSKSITMKGCTEAAMKALKNYIYTGEMDLMEFSLPTLLRIMNFSRQILIEDDLYNSIEAYVKDTLNIAKPVSSASHSLTEETERSLKYISEYMGKVTKVTLLECPALVEEFCLENLKEPVMQLLTFFLIIWNMNKSQWKSYLPDFTDSQWTLVDENRNILLSEFQKLSLKTVKDVVNMKYDKNKEVQKLFEGFGLTRIRFSLFVDWYSTNEANCAKMEKKVILASFNYMDFTGEELVTVVGRSGMFSREEVDRMLIEKFRENDEEIDNLLNI